MWPTTSSRNRRRQFEDSGRAPRSTRSRRMQGRRAADRDAVPRDARKVLGQRVHRGHGRRGRSGISVAQGLSGFAGEGKGEATGGASGPRPSQRRKKATKTSAGSSRPSARAATSRSGWCMIGAAGAAAGAEADGPARRRPVRDQRPERPVPPRDQPEQSGLSEAASSCSAPDDHRPQREADAAGGGGRV